MNKNIKYGVVAALTMAAFVAPSVGAYTVTNPGTSTNSTTGVVTKTGTVKFNGTATLVYTNKAFDGSSIADILDSTIIKDDDGSNALTAQVSHYDGANLTWYVDLPGDNGWRTTGTPAGGADGSTKDKATALTATDPATVGTYNIVAKDSANVEATGSIVISKAVTSASTATASTADGKDLTYTGADITPTFTLGGIKLRAGDIDGAVKYVDTSTNTIVDSLTKVGSYKATFTVKEGADLDLDGNTGDSTAKKEVTATFTIGAASIANGTVTVAANDGYTGEAITPVVTLKAIDVDDAITDAEGEILAAQKDNFTVAFSNNTNVGTATVTVTGKGNYTGSVSKTFKIAAKELNAAPDTTVLYTGSAITPAKVGAYTSGFTIKFADGVNHTDKGTVEYLLIGDGVNIITSQTGAKGNLTISTLNLTNVVNAQVFTNDAKAKEYSIEHANTPVVVLSSKAYNDTPTIKAIYADGNAVSTSLFTINKFTAAAKEGADATITLNGDTTASAAGNISATGTITYTAEGASISGATISGIANKTYNGKAQTQKISVTLDGKTLVEGTDYVASYKNNAAVGTATVTIYGLGDYSGSVSKTFKINPAKAKISKVTVGSKKMTVKVKKGSGAAGVQIAYRVKGTSKWTYKTTTGTSKTIKSLKKGKKYQVVVRSYKKVSGTTYYSAWSAKKTSAKIK